MTSVTDKFADIGVLSYAEHYTECESSIDRSATTAQNATRTDILSLLSIDRQNCLKTKVGWSSFGHRGLHPLRGVETTMIRGVHTMFYSSQPDEFRAFVRDKLGFSSHTDVGGGWLIFDLPEADLGCHPAGPQEGETSGTPSISFYCDDIQKTVAELKGRGVEFVDSVEDHGYGLVTHFARRAISSCSSTSQSTQRMHVEPRPLTEIAPLKTG